jgi:hypothetical protein
MRSSGGFSGGRHYHNNLLQFSDLTYEGSFRPPTGNGLGGLTMYGYMPEPFGALWFDPAGDGGNGSLICAGKSAYGGIGEFSIAARKDPSVEALDVATNLNTPAELTEGKYTFMGGLGGGEYLVGGVMRDGSNMYINGWLFYDAGTGLDYSCFRREYSWNTSSGTVTDPFRIGNIEQKTSGSKWMAGFTAGNFATINNAYWRTLLGGDTFVGMGGTSITSRTSCGPAALAFNKADLATATYAGGPVTAQKCLYYADPSVSGFSANSRMHRGFGTDFSPSFNGMWTMQGMLHPTGWDCIIFFCRGGKGNFCYGGAEYDQAYQANASNNYGYGVGYFCGNEWSFTGPGDSQDTFPTYPEAPRDAANQGQLNTVPGTNFFSDYASAVAGRGNATYAEPYTYVAIAYRLTDLQAAKEGSINPQAIEPYGIWSYNPKQRLVDWFNYGGSGVAYDATNRRIFVMRHRSSLFTTDNTAYNGEFPIVDCYTHALGPRGAS